MSDHLPPPRGIGNLLLSPPSYRTLLEALADEDFWGGMKYTCLEYAVGQIIKILEMWQQLQTRGESERVHYSWLTLPDRNIVTIAMQRLSGDPMKVLDSMFMYSMYNIIKKINNGKSKQQWLEDLKEFNFNLIDLILHYQGETIAVKFNKKYEVCFDADEATNFYKQARDGGLGGRYNCINEMHLSLFGENAYDDWSCFSSISYAELVTTDLNENDENLPQCISITISNSLEEAL